MQFAVPKSRRGFLKSSAGVLLGGVLVPSWLADLGYAATRFSAQDKRKVGNIGVGGQGTGIARNSARFGTIVAVCDVDDSHAARAKESFEKDFGGSIETYNDYRKLLDRQDIEAVTIGTPDHWHSKICMDAMKAGKDVYCEKPLTLTIDEGKQLIKTVQETGRVLQVGTQQRSEMGSLFVRAVATVRSGQLGEIKNVTVSLPLSTEEGGPFAKQEVPGGFNWDFWLGQAPQADYCPERSHFRFRWWYEYSGGILTDWGAHHMDIAQWALGMDHSGPVSIDGSATVMPTIAGGFNTPKHPTVDCLYANGVPLKIVAGDEGVLFEGSKGRIYVNRGRITGKPIEDQDADKGLQDKIAAMMTELYHGRQLGDHMGNFFESIADRNQPISDVVSQHRSVSACHLANISCRLGRKLKWDPEAEQFVGDEEANAMLSREQRSPYQLS